MNNDGTFDITPANQTTNALVAGSTETETWSNAWVAVAGTHRLEVCSDVGLAITESDETNNCTTMTFTVASAAPTGLVAAYSFNQGSGTTVTDSSGNNNNGNLAGTVLPTWTTPGKYNGALSFNGTSARVNVPNSSSLQLTTPR